MGASLATNRTAAAIWSRVVKPDRATLPPEIARLILKLDFDAEDHRAIERLSAKAQEGTLTPEERSELEEYIRVNDALTVLRSKARLSLGNAGQKP
jgi:hypothetical protein